jgi:hypothetical protein
MTSPPGNVIARTWKFGTSSAAAKYVTRLRTGAVIRWPPTTHRARFHRNCDDGASQRLTNASTAPELRGRTQE